MDPVVERFITYIRNHHPKNAVACEIFVNASEYTLEYRFRDAESLKRDGISMKDLGGEFIK